jgi:cation transport protein ChaC
MWITDTPQRQVSALCYVVDRSHPQYAGRLTLDEQLRLVLQGHGQSGANPDYVIETVKSMEAIGYREGELHQLVERLTQAR